MDQAAALEGGLDLLLVGRDQADLDLVQVDRDWPAQCRLQEIPRVEGHLHALASGAEDSATRR